MLWEERYGGKKDTTGEVECFGGKLRLAFPPKVGEANPKTQRPSIAFDDGDGGGGGGDSSGS